MLKTSTSICALLALAGLAAPALADEPVVDPAVLRSQALEAQYKAEAQAYVAAKAKSDAQAAAASAQLGPLSAYQTPGAIEVGANSGKLEVTLLAAETTRLSAAGIVKDLCSMLASSPAVTACGPTGAGPASIIIFTDSEKPTFDALDAFTAQARSIRAHLLRVKDLQPPSGPKPGGVISSSTLGFAAISTLLSTAGNLLRSDYKLSAVEVTQSDALLVKTFLQEARRADLKPSLYVPSLYGGRIDYDTNAAIKTLEELESARNGVKQRADALRQLLEEEPKRKAAIDPIIAQMDAAVARFDAFSVKLGTADEKGSVPLSVVARQAAQSALIGDDTYMLVLKAEMAGGSAYSKKNFWTFLGEMPFSVSGGSLVSYTLLRGRNGAVADAGVRARTLPFTKIHQATRRFSAQ